MKYLIYFITVDKILVYSLYIYIMYLIVKINIIYYYLYYTIYN